MALIIGCKPKSVPDQAKTASPEGAYFRTPFQTECEFIVHEIVSDVAEQMYFAANHQLPDPKSFSVNVTEKPGSPVDAPVYTVEVHLGQKWVKCEVAVDGPIWSSRIYRDVTAQLAQAAGLKEADATPKTDTAWLVTLSDSKPAAIEKENQRLSDALKDDFNNPELHEEAAVLIGAFLLRDHSGQFMEIRSPLCRLTSHLVMADFLRGTAPAGRNGQMAEAMMLALVNAGTPAMERLKALGTNDSNVIPFVRVLQARCTGDYRPLDKISHRTPIEDVARFNAWAGCVGGSQGWQRLTDEQKSTIDFVRSANNLDYSVEMGHQLMAVAGTLETQEANSIYGLSQSGTLDEKNFAAALNALPEHCVARNDKEVQVRIIGWGQWADFLQRHLCHAVQQSYYFMRWKWGVGDEAKKFASECDKYYSDLRLYPFVRRYDCSDVESYHRAVDDGFKVIAATPHLVPANCWNEICYDVDFAPPYKPQPNPHVSEWHSHNPLPGTVYDLYPRLNHISLVGRADAVAKFEQLYELSPWIDRVTDYIFAHKYDNHPTVQQANALLQPSLPYSVYALRWMAAAAYNEPEQYRKWMLQVATVNPWGYFELANYEVDHNDEDAAARYLDEGVAADPDAVLIASRACWRVRYCLRKGQIEKARQISDYAAMVYSESGLESKALFNELTSNCDDALRWYAAVEERYDNSTPLLEFCGRYKSETGDTRFDKEVKKRENKLFPQGMEKVSIKIFHGPPTDGVSVSQQSDLLTQAGLRPGDVIVALNEIRTHSCIQYMYIRDTLINPEMRLIAWQGSGYNEIKTAPPNHKFNAKFEDFHPR